MYIKILLSLVLLLVSSVSHAKLKCPRPSTIAMPANPGALGASILEEITIVEGHYNKMKNIERCRYTGTLYQYSQYQNRVKVGPFKYEKFYYGEGSDDNPSEGYNVQIWLKEPQKDGSIKEIFFCSGTALAGGDWILTANHCLLGFGSSNIDGSKIKNGFVVGNITKTSQTDLRQVSNIDSFVAVGPDLLLLRLKEPMILKNYIGINNDYWDQGFFIDEKFSGLKADLFGWGTGEGKVRSKLKKREVVASETSFFDGTMEPFSHLDFDVSNTTFFQGDSGGACISGGLLFGAISLGQNGGSTVLCALVTTGPSEAILKKIRLQ